MTRTTWRSHALAAATVVTVVLGAAPVHAAQPRGRLDLATPEGALQAFRKVQCSSKDASPVVYHWVGEVFSRVPGEPDRILFRFDGMNVRQCVTVSDPQRGTGFRQVSREVLFYMDPVSGEIVDEWKNPWTGETVKVLHIANDPVNFRAPIHPVGADGKPYRGGFRTAGDQWWTTTTVPLFYSNPLAGEYQDYVGGTYHATEMFNFFGSVSDLTDPGRDSAQVSVAWARVSDWLPWMKMRGRAGMLYFNGAGTKIGGFDELPAAFRAAIEARQPLYRTPPPVDDARPNETSWTYFKKMMPAKGATGH